VEAELFELGDEAAGGAVGVAAGEVVAAEFAVELAGCEHVPAAGEDRVFDGAERTPEVFLFDRDRKLVYHGAIDDSRDEGAVTQRYLRDAIEAVLAGDEPPVRETPPVGCTVKWRA